MLNNLFRRISLLAMAVALSIASSWAQTKTFRLSDPIPFNPNVKVNTLENGLTYYIMKNAKPEKRAELRLMVNAGSILETEEQRGLAHFLEHMAFNGTKNFKKDELLRFLELTGVRFGADLNAYTSFDETVYMLQIPTDKKDVVEKAFLVLEDWSRNVAFDPDEIEKERGVVIEEWRLRRGASQRIRDKQFPVIFKNSRYAERLPIGTKENLESFKHESLISFYRKWYRPDLTAVVAVGDFDPDEIEALIKKHFSSFALPAEPHGRTTSPVPDHRETLYSIVTDPEAVGTSISLYFKLEPKQEKKVVDYRRAMMEELFAMMFNERLQEILLQGDPPFVSAYGGKSSLVRTKDAFRLFASVKSEGIDRGLRAILTEAMRVFKHGFTETELERAKTNLLRQFEDAFKEKDKTESASHAGEMMAHFLNQVPMPGIELEYELYKKYLPSINAGEVNRLASEWMAPVNRVVTLSMPEKKDVSVPTEEHLARLIAETEQSTVEPYVDKVSNKPLVESLPAGSPIVSEKEHSTLGVTEWKLGNGIRVLLKPTDFKNDEIVFSALSPGGYSLEDRVEKLFSAQFTSAVFSVSGVGDFDETALRKALTGKTVRVSPWVSETHEGFSGSAAPKDLTTLFDLIFLHATQPRKDSIAYNSFASRIKTFIENFGAMPEAVFSDTVQTVASNYHPRQRPMTKERFGELSLDDVYAFYRDRFADLSDFTFLFVGNFSPDSLKPLVERYLGALPSKKRAEKWKDHNIVPAEGIVKRTVEKGIEEKSRVMLMFAGPFDWSYESAFATMVLENHLDRRLREQLREDKGGTYGVSVNISLEKYPRSQYSAIISFGCKPDRVQELTDLVFEELHATKTNGGSDEDIAKIKEIIKRERETNLKEDSFWLQMLQSAIMNEEPMDAFLTKFEAASESISSDMLKVTSGKYLKSDNYMHFVLLPEKKESK